MRARSELRRSWRLAAALLIAGVLASLVGKYPARGDVQIAAGTPSFYRGQLTSAGQLSNWILWLCLIDGKGFGVTFDENEFKVQATAVATRLQGKRKSNGKYKFKGYRLNQGNQNEKIGKLVAPSAGQQINGTFKLYDEEGTFIVNKASRNGGASNALVGKYNTVVQGEKVQVNLSANGTFKAKKPVGKKSITLASGVWIVDTQNQVWVQTLKVKKEAEQQFQLTFNPKAPSAYNYTYNGNDLVLLNQFNGDVVLALDRK